MNGWIDYLLGVSQNIVAGWMIYLWHFKKHIKPALQRLEHHGTDGLLHPASNSDSDAAGCGRIEEADESSKDS